VHLPDMQMHTTSFWLTIPDPLLRELGIARAQAVDALRGVNVALETVATIALSCDPRDINHTLGDKSGDTPEKRAGEGPIDGFDPTLFLFDAYPGGVGLAVRMYERADELLNDARELLAGCSCEKGCPACVGPGDIIGSGRKAIALRILDSIGIDGRRPALAK
jgi:DEAD/DEAH box helicase domain-containing protein